MKIKRIPPKFIIADFEKTQWRKQAEKDTINEVQTRAQEIASYYLFIGN